MNEDFVNITAFGRCKCCLGESELMSLWEIHEFEGEEENYGEMLNECFSIGLQPSDGMEMICECCVIRLREASSFKKEIVATQELLQEGVYINVEIDIKNIQMEAQEDNGPAEDVYEKVEYLDEDEDYDSSPERKRKHPKKKPRRERNKTYKQYSRNDLEEAARLVCSGELTCCAAADLYDIPKATLLTKTNMLKGKDEVDEDKKASNERHHAFVEEIKTLLSYTNAIPFRTKACRYYCFYCTTDGPIFEEPDDLRNHTNTEHFRERITSIEHCMKPQWINEVIKLNVQGLQCAECLILLPDWNQMFVHFAEIHSIGFDQAYTRVIPYVLTAELKCVLCHEIFHNYGYLDAHMNLHYSNHICHKCGAPFLAVSRLDKHLKTHKVGNYPCNICNRVFSLSKYRARHFALVHNHTQDVKCLYCPETFVTPIQRHMHVVEKHEDKVKTITCEVCGKVFTWKPYFNQHMRRIHKGEKKHMCQYCDKAFLQPHELRNHEKKHLNYECGICGAAGNTLRDLRIHLQEHEEYGQINDCTEQKSMELKSKECSNDIILATDMKMHLKKT